MSQNPDNAFPAVTSHMTYYGCTKREYFAALALQGNLASGKVGMGASERANWAVQCADALIVELNKEKP